LTSCNVIMDIAADFDFLNLEGCQIHCRRSWQFT
jgi:hypothetical protein